MSLTHVIPPEASSTLERLHHKSLLEVVSSCLEQTAFSFRLKLKRVSEADKVENVVPRVHINRLDYYYKSLEEDFKPNDCEVISNLYKSGLGLPQDDRLAAYWSCFSTFTQPVQDDVIVTLDDLMHVLSAHINQARRDSWGGRYAYQQSVNVHYQSFARYTFRGKHKETLEAIEESGARKGFKLSRPSKARSGFIVYKYREGQYQLYGSWVESDNKPAPFIRQVMDSSIPSKIPSDCLKDYGTYLTIPGYFAFKDTVKDIIVSPGTVDDIWDDCLEQDLFSHSDFKPEESPAVRASKEFLTKYRDTNTKAKAFLAKHEGSKDRNIKRKLKSAKALIKAFTGHETTVSNFRTENRAWDKLNPAKHLDFFAYDMFMEDPIKGFRQVKTDYANILTKLSQCDFNTLPCETVKFSSKFKKTFKKRDLIRIANNTAPIDIHDLWFGG